MALLYIYDILYCITKFSLFLTNLYVTESFAMVSSVTYTRNPPNLFQQCGYLWCLGIPVEDGGRGGVPLCVAAAAVGRPELLVERVHLGHRRRKNTEEG